MSDERDRTDREEHDVAAARSLAVAPPARDSETDGAVDPTAGIEPLLSARQLAAILGLTAGTIINWFEAKKIPGYRLTGRVGAPVRFRWSQVEPVVESWRVGPTSSPSPEDVA